MIWQTSRPTVRALRRVRFCLLALVALFAAHDAVFLAEFGFGDTFAAVMRRTGHDAYWPAYMLLVGLAAGMLVAEVRRLPHRAASPSPRSARAAGVLWGCAAACRNAPPPDRRGAVLWPRAHWLWTRLVAVVALGFVLQENAERLDHGHLPASASWPALRPARPAGPGRRRLLRRRGRRLVRWRRRPGGPPPARPKYGWRAAGLRRRGHGGPSIAATIVAHALDHRPAGPGRAPPRMLHAA